MIAKTSDTRISLQKRVVTLEGITDILFDRYPGDNQTKLEWHQKTYLPPDSSTLSLPCTNVISFLSSHNTNSAPKRLRDARQYKKIANACLSFCIVTATDGGQWIPFMRDGKPIILGKPKVDRDEKSGLYLHRTVARLDKGIPNPKERPALPAPWSLTFHLDIVPNKEIKEQEIRNLIEEGGIAIGLGTFRGVYGKFLISEWRER